MHPLRVVTYNVRYFGHGTRGLASTAKAMKRIAGALVALDPLPDIVCLQEVETESFRSTVAHPSSRPDGHSGIRSIIHPHPAVLRIARRWVLPILLAQH